MPSQIGGVVTAVPSPQGIGANVAARAALDAALVVYEGGGKWQEMASRGLLYTGISAAAGVNLPVYTSTTQQFVVVNPTGNSVAAIIKGWVGSFVGGPTPVAGLTQLAGSNYGAASAAAPSGTANTIFNNETQLTTGSKLQCLNAATVVAATWYKPSGITVWTTTAGNTPIGTSTFGEDVDGSLILKPGQWIAIAANVATFGTAQLAMTWAEVPVGLVN